MSFVPRARRRRENAAVLIVDDNAAVRGCLEAMFTALGYRADLAADGQEALPKLAASDYAAVICDLYMPRMDGDQLYVVCRERHRELAILAAWCLGCFAIALRICAFECGSSDSGKPCTPGMTSARTLP